MFGEQKTTIKAEGLDEMAPSIIGADLTVTGNVTSKGAIQVEGEIQGDVYCATLVIGTQGRITGGVTAEEVNVHGRVVGSIRAINATLQSTAHVEGDIHHQSLKLEHGGFFEGKSMRSDEPVSIFENTPNQRSTPETASDAGKARNSKLQRVA
jgi:cytoskeletal protein CcmA (bactofilin family)